MKMVRYKKSLLDNNRFPDITKIEVPTEYDKEQLLLALEYLHDRNCIDTDYLAVNTLLHLYHRPDLIVVTNLQDVSHE